MFSHRLLFPKDSSITKKDVGSTVIVGNNELECMLAQVWLIIVTLAKMGAGMRPRVSFIPVVFLVMPCTNPTML